MREALHGHEPTIGGAAGEARPLRPEESGPHRGMNPVGTHEHTGSGTRAVGERELDAITLILKADEPVVELHAFGWQRLGERAEEISAVEMVVGGAEGRLHRFP